MPFAKTSFNIRFFSPHKQIEDGSCKTLHSNLHIFQGFMSHHYFFFVNYLVFIEFGTNSLKFLTSHWKISICNFVNNFQGSPHTLSREFGAQEFRGVIKQLVPGRTYVFKIQAETRVGFGPETAWKQKMPILAPPKPNGQVVPTEVCKSSTTIQIRFRKNYFSEENGPVSILVCQNY